MSPQRILPLDGKLRFAALALLFSAVIVTVLALTLRGSRPGTKNGRQSNLHHQCHVDDFDSDEAAASQLRLRRQPTTLFDLEVNCKDDGSSEDSDDGDEDSLDDFLAGEFAYLHLPSPM